jgi:hypothetical protein
VLLTRLAYQCLRADGVKVNTARIEAGGEIFKPVGGDDGSS